MFWSLLEGNAQPSSDAWAEFHHEGFFGYGDKGDFQLFSLAHIIPVVLLVVAVILTYVFREKIKSLKHEKWIRIGLACLMLLAELGYFWRLLYVGPELATNHSLLTKLPLQVCEWTCLFAVFMVLIESKHLFDIDVFACLTLGLFPLLIPSVIQHCGPTYFRYYQFWGEHLLPVYSVFYMMFVKGFKFEYKKVYKSLIFLVTLSALCIIANEFLAEYGANYMYFRRIGVDALDNLLPSNQYLRLAIYAPIALACFGLEIFIFWLIDRKRNPKEVNPLPPLPLEK